MKNELSLKRLRRKLIDGLITSEIQGRKDLRISVPIIPPVRGKFLPWHGVTEGFSTLKRI